MHPDTSLIHLGRTTAATAHAVHPPLVRASTMLFDTLAEFKQSYAGVAFEAPRYGRYGTATNFELQQAMARIAQTESCIAAASGLSAIAAVLGAHAGPGRHILLYEGVYGPTRALCEKELAARGTRIDFFKDAAEAARLIDADTSLVYVETPSSLKVLSRR